MFTVLESKDGTLTVRLTGEIDHHCAGKMRDEIDAAIEYHRPERLILDFGGVSFMDSSGIGLVMGRYRLMKSIGGEVTVANTPKPLKKVMRISGLYDLAKFDDEEENKSETDKQHENGI